MSENVAEESMEQLDTDESESMQEDFQEEVED